MRGERYRPSGSGEAIALFLVIKKHIGPMPELLPEDSLGLDELERRRTRNRNRPVDPRTWKAALALEIEQLWFIRKFGLDHCALLTLVFDPLTGGATGATNVTPEDAQDCFKAAWKHLLPQLFRAYVAVLDFHRSGQIHFHVLVACQFNIRDGWDFAIDEQHRAIQKRAKKEKRKLTTDELGASRMLTRRMTSSSLTKDVWQRLREKLPDLGYRKNFPFELKPVRDPVRLARYLARAYKQSQAARELRPPHSWCRRFSKSYPRCVDNKLRFSPVGPSARLFRQKKSAVGSAFGFSDIGEMIDAFGKSWEYTFRSVLSPVNPVDPQGFFSWQRTELWTRAEEYRRHQKWAWLHAA